MLSLDDNVSDHSKGTAVRLPLVEEIFNINSILKDPLSMSASQQTAHSTDTENAFPSLSLDVVEEPVNMIQYANDELAVHIPSQLKQNIWEHIST